MEMTDLSRKDQSSVETVREKPNKQKVICTTRIVCLFVVVMISLTVKEYFDTINHYARLKVMDTETDHEIYPCDDFYKFVVGKWQMASVQQDSKQKGSVTNAVVVKQREHISDLLEAPLQDTDGPSFKSALTFTSELRRTCPEQAIDVHWLRIANKIAVNEYKTEATFKEVIGKAEKMFTGINESLKVMDLPYRIFQYNSLYWTSIGYLTGKLVGIFMKLLIPMEIINRPVGRPLKVLRLSLKSLTEDQQFFLSFAQYYCETIPKELWREAMTNKIHSPGRFRVLGTLQNSPEFSKALSCPVGSKMNPYKKCLPWKVVDSKIPYYLNFVHVSFW